MRVVSWNVWWRFGPCWRRRQHGIAATLRALRPDVVGLQESWATEETSQAEELASLLDMHAAFAAPSLPPPPDPPESPDQVGVEVGVALLSRWPIVRVHEHRLPSRHRTEPVALQATLDHPAGPLSVVAAGTEWEPAYVDDHRDQIAALADLMSRPELDGPLPVLLAADLNAGPDSELLSALTTDMTDTWPAGGGESPGITFSSANPHSPADAPQQIDRRIDYILARSGRLGTTVEVHRAFVARDAVDGLVPSDHYAVVADLAP